MVAICFQYEPIPLRFDSILSFSLTIQVLRFVTELKPLTLQCVPELVGHLCVHESLESYSIRQFVL